MTRRRFWLTAAGLTVVVATIALVVRNQVKVYRGRQAAALVQPEPQQPPVAQQPPSAWQLRQALFEMLQPVARSATASSRDSASRTTAAT